MTLSAGNQERELRRELDQARRNLENAEHKFQSDKKRIIDEYEAKAKTTSGTVERDLRR